MTLQPDDFLEERRRLGVKQLSGSALACTALEDVLDHGQTLVAGRGEELFNQEVMGVNLHGLFPP
jgi:hypothetical protein